jgi:DNA end-binding protein Ku
MDQMTEDWDPARYTDEYRSALMKLIDQKIASGGKELPQPDHGKKRATNVIDLAAVLQQSLKDASAGTRAKKPPAAKAKKPAKKKAA